MFDFLKKYSPKYSENTLEGWSVILVVAVGGEASTFANNWVEMFGLFVIGIVIAHIVACIIKFLLKKHRIIMKKIKAFFICILFSCLMAVCGHEVSTPAPQSEMFYGINYYAQHGGGSNNSKARAGVIATACMKAALVGSGVGPIGSILASATVGL